MKNDRTKIGLILLLVFLVHITGMAYAQSEIMSVGEIQIGMRGIGKTVISGTAIEEFDVEILGILRGQSLVGDLILVRVSGPLIEKTGGIAAGMSGSPVYVDGRLIGAIGYGWGMTDHQMGLVTPIESMLQVFAKDASEPSERIYLEFEQMQQPGLSHRIQARQTQLSRSVQLAEAAMIEGEVVTEVHFSGSYQEALAYQSKEKSFVAYPASTPLMVNGLKGRALSRLMDDLKKYNLVPVQTGGTMSSAHLDQPLQPGSAIAAQLVRGDIDVSAIGTLTYVEGDRFLAFGHPFMKLGSVEYILSDAEILTVVDSLDTPFKLGVAGEPRGVVTQDRNTAIAGSLLNTPRIIPVTVIVQDLDLHEKQEIAFQVIRDEELMVSLVTNAVLQAIDTVMDRQGYGTSTLRLQIVGDKLPDQMIRYQNMYYSMDDIAAGSLSDLYNILDVIIVNPFDTVNVSSIQVELQVLRNRQFAIVEEIKLLNQALYPGDSAQVQVTFRPYRGELVQHVYDVKIPEHIEPGEATLNVSGGPFSVYSEEEGSDEFADDEMVAVGDHIKTLDDLLKLYLKQPRNNELLIEIVPYHNDSMDSTEGASDLEDEESAPKSEPSKVSVHPGVSRKAETVPESDSDKETGLMKETFPTQYVLEGNLSLEITISAPEENSDDDVAKDSMGNVMKESK